MEGEYIVLVGTSEVPEVLGEALERGLEVRRCPAEPHVRCPEVHGERCDLRRSAKAAVVYLSGEHEFFGQGRWRCVTAGLAPTVVVLEGSKLESRARCGFSVVGSERGPEAVLAALADLFD